MYFYFRSRLLFISICRKKEKKKDQEENQGVEDSFPDCNKLVARAELSILINETSEKEIIIVN